MKKHQKKISETEALSRLMELCSQSEKSAFEVRQKLKQWNLDTRAHSIIAKLASEKFIDDRRFAKAFSHDKFLINKWGKIKIKFLLRSHQISDSIIDKGLAQIDEEDYAKMVEVEMTKKNQSLKISNRFKRKTKLYAFGSQRGYESELLNQFFEKKDSSYLISSFKTFQICYFYLVRLCVFFVNLCVTDIYSYSTKFHKEDKVTQIRFRLPQFNRKSFNMKEVS